MKKCLICNKEYRDDFNYCSKCGTKLHDDAKRNPKNKGVIVTIIAVVIVFAIIIGFALSNEMSIINTKQSIEDNKYQKALQEQLSTPTIFDLRVNSGWTNEIDGDYIYIKGSVTNISSSKTISYYEVGAKFYDSMGNVVDSDYTNDGTELSPGETRQFDMMHKYDSNVKNIKLSIQKVS